MSGSELFNHGDQVQQQSPEQEQSKTMPTLAIDAFVAQRELLNSMLDKIDQLVDMGYGTLDDIKVKLLSMTNKKSQQEIIKFAINEYQSMH